MDSVLSLFILAVVQGLTEFLPISSSAHLVLFSDLLGGREYDVGIVVVLHVATLFASVVYFRQDIRRLATGLFSRASSVDRSEAYAVLLGMLPIAFVGLFVYPMFSSLQAVMLVAIALVVSGSLLLFADYAMRKRWVGGASDVALWRKGLGIGMMQVFALLPGVSRSGVTISGGRLFGFSRRQATRFSFLLAIPAIAGALLLLLVQSPPDALSFGGVGIGVLMLAMCVSGIVAYATIHFFLRFVERVGFVPFFGYQVLLGVVLLLLPSVI